MRIMMDGKETIIYSLGAHVTAIIRATVTKDALRRTDLLRPFACSLVNMGSLALVF